jgi:hypothetical protein
MLVGTTLRRSSSLGASCEYIKAFVRFLFLSAVWGGTDRSIDGLEEVLEVAWFSILGSISSCWSSFDDVEKHSVSSGHYSSVPQ